MNLPQGTFVFPSSINAGAVRALAASLRTTSERLDSVDDSLDLAAQTARQTWQGAAADTFSHHMNDRGHVFELASATVREATGALEDLADAIDRAERAYVNAVEAERIAATRDSPRDQDEAVWSEAEAVGLAIAASRSCDQTLTALANRLAAYIRPVRSCLWENISTKSASTTDWLDAISLSMRSWPPRTRARWRAIRSRSARSTTAATSSCSPG